MQYPYLGSKSFNEEEHVTVFFIRKNEGVIVESTSNNSEYSLGQDGYFNEDEYEFLMPPICVRLNN